MEFSITKDYHRFLSIILFIFCLFFDAFYTSDTYLANSSVHILLIGWFGVLAGNFMWFANPIFFIALTSKNKKTSLYLSLLGIALSLSFILKENLRIGDGPIEPIVAYGLGYFLWVLAFITFFLGEILNKFRLSIIKKSISLLISILIFSAFYGIYYSHGEKSIYQLFLKREQAFDELCHKVKEMQYKQVTGIKGVFVDNVPGFRFTDISGQKHQGWGGSQVGGYVYNGYINFEEERPHNSKETTLPYIRTYSNNPNVRIPVSELMSNYSVTSIDLAAELPKALGIKSYKILVKSLESNEIYAESSFVSIINEQRICVPTDKSSYSVADFVRVTLNLKTK